VDDRFELFLHAADRPLAMITAAVATSAGRVKGIHFGEEGNHLAYPTTECGTFAVERWSWRLPLRRW
jgi:hypothetical protein